MRLLIGRATRRSYPCAFLLCAGLVVTAKLVHADTTYTYTGNPFTDFNGTYSCFMGNGQSRGPCRIFGSFTLSQPLRRSSLKILCHRSDVPLGEREAVVFTQQLAGCMNCRSRNST
jgi:hypothetical protein